MNLESNEYGLSKPIDFDNDGDIDVISNSSGNIYFFETLQPATLNVAIDQKSRVNGDSVGLGITSPDNALVSTLVLENTGDDTLSISGYQISGSFELSQNIPTKLASGQSEVLNMTFSSSSNGEYSGEFAIQSNDTHSSSFVITLGAVVDDVPEINVTYNEADILQGDTLLLNGILNKELAAELVISNPGTANLSIPDIATGTGITLTAGFNENIPPDNSSVATIELFTDSSSTYFAPVTIYNNDPNEADFEFFIEWNVSPVGVQVTDSEGVILAGSVLDFNTVNVNVPVTVTLTVTNIGNEVVSAESIQLPEGFSSTFEPTELDLEASFEFDLIFDASYGGSFEGTVTIITSEEGITEEFSVKGLVQAPDFQLEGDGNLLTSGYEIDYGVTAVDQPVTKQFVFSNAGEGDLILADLTLPDGYSLEGAFPEKVESFSNEVFSVSLDAEEVGIFEGELSFKTNDPANRTFIIQLFGEVSSEAVPAIKVTSSRGTVQNEDVFKLGVTTLDNALVETFTITNSGTSALEIGEITVSPSDNFLLINEIQSIAPGSSKNFTVIFSAADSGSYNTELAIPTNVDDTEEFKLSLTATSSPTELSEIVVQNGGKSIANGATFTFRNTHIDHPQQATFHMFNYGNTDLQISNLSLPEGFELIGEFPKSDPFDMGDPSVIEPLTSAEFSISFDATALGLKEGTLSFSTNDLDEDPFEILLSASVLEPVNASVLEPVNASVLIDDQLIASDGLFDFGKVLQEDTAFATLTIKNEGGFELELSEFSISEHFKIKDSFPTKIDGKSEEDVSIYFTNETLGEYSGTLAFNTSDTSKSTYTISLTAESVEVLGVEDHLSSLVYPNPATKQVSVDLNYSNQSEFNARLVDLNGREVWRKTNLKPNRSGTLELNIESVNSGAYQLILESVDGKKVFKLIKR